FNLPIGPNGAHDVEIHGGGLGDSLVLQHTFATDLSPGGQGGFPIDQEIPQFVTLTAGGEADLTIPPPSIDDARDVFIPRSRPNHPFPSWLAAGGTFLDIAGSHLRGAIHVTFGGISARHFLAVSDSEIIADPAPGSDVTV